MELNIKFSFSQHYMPSKRFKHPRVRFMEDEISVHIQEKELRKAFFVTESCGYNAVNVTEVFSDSEGQLWQLGDETMARRFIGTGHRGYSYEDQWCEKSWEVSNEKLDVASEIIVNAMGVCHDAVGNFYTKCGEPIYMVRNGYRGTFLEVLWTKEDMSPDEKMFSANRYAEALNFAQGLSPSGVDERGHIVVLDEGALKWNPESRYSTRLQELKKRANLLLARVAEIDIEKCDSADGLEEILYALDVSILRRAKAQRLI